MAYSFEQVFAADPSNPANVARNAAVTIFAPGDVAQTPLTLTTPNGDPLANPLQVNNNGFGSAFMHATLDRVAWSGGNFTGFFTSYEGMKAEAVSARTAAQAAASTAGADAAAVATAAIGTATDDAEAAATSAAAAATAAANSAALVGAPADAAIAAAINGAGTATKTALSAAIDTQVAASPVVAAKVTKTDATQREGYPAHAIQGGYIPRFQFDKGRSLYNGGATLQRIRAKLAVAAAGLGHCHIVCAGDSTTAGSIGANRATQSYPAVLKSMLPALGYPIAGSGIVITGTNDKDPRVTFGGTGWTYPTSMLHSYSSTIGNTITFAHTDAGTIVRIYHTDNSGAFNYTIDGGAAVLKTPTNQTGDLKYVEVTGLADTTHTIVVTSTTTTALQVVGTEVRKATGVSVSNFGSNGTNTAAWAAVNSGQFSNIGRQTAPDLVILNLGINDAIQSQTPAATKANLIATINYWKALADVDYVLVSPSPTGAAAWANTFHSVWEAADELDIALVDLAAVMGTNTKQTALGTMVTADNTHPNPAGYRMIANLHAQALLR